MQVVWGATRESEIIKLEVLRDLKSLGLRDMTKMPIGDELHLELQKGGMFE